MTVTYNFVIPSNQWPFICATPSEKAWMIAAMITAVGRVNPAWPVRLEEWLRDSIAAAANGSLSFALGRSPVDNTERHWPVSITFQDDGQAMHFLMFMGDRLKAT